MLICASITTLVVNGSKFYSEYEQVAYWEITSFEYFTSIFFIDPSVFGSTFGQTDARWVEGVYWTLWREVLFYLTVAALFWTVPARFFALTWATLQGFSTILLIYPGSLENSGTIGVFVEQLLQPTTLAFFTVGMFLWRAKNNQLERAMCIAVGFAVVSITARTGIQLNWAAEIDAHVSAMAVIYRAGMYFSIGALVCLAVFKPVWVNVLTHRWLQVIGLISYPLYLCHERIGMIFLHYLHDAGFPSLLALGFMLAIVFCLAYFVHRFIEMPGKNTILKLFSK